MASITTTLGLAPQGDDLPSIRTNVWTDDHDVTCAAVYFRVGASEFGLNASADQVDQLLRDALNALGEAVGAHDEQYAIKPEAVPA